MNVKQLLELLKDQRLDAQVFAYDANLEGEAPVTGIEFGTIPAILGRPKYHTVSIQTDDIS